VRQWWGRWPDANIGLVTGKVSEIVVLDVDPRHGGDESLRDLIAADSSITETMTVITGSGGMHLYFQHPGRVIRDKIAFRPGLDFRGDGEGTESGGHVVMPPSLHLSGHRYNWEISAGIGSVIIPLPSSVLSALTSERRGGPSTTFDIEIALLGVPDGQRGNWAAQVAGWFIGQGKSLEETIALLRFYNEQNRPPMDNSRIDATVKSIWAAEQRKKAMLDGNLGGLAPESLTDAERLEMTRLNWGSLGIHDIEDWRLIMGPVPVYVLVTRGIAVNFGDDISTLKSVRAKLLTATGHYLPEMKANAWGKVAERLWICARKEEYESTLASDRVDGWLRDFLFSHQTREATLQERGYMLRHGAVIYEGSVVVRATTLRMWLEADSGEHISLQAVTQMLKLAGCERLTVAITSPSGTASTMAVWRVPDHLFSGVL